MSTTPMSRFPVKTSDSQEGADGGDYSMMVEPPTHVDEDEGEEGELETEPADEVTVKLQPQSQEYQQTSPTRSQPFNMEQSQTMPAGDILDRRQARTPEPQKQRSHNGVAQRASISPGLEPLDWEGFEKRYQRAFQEADDQERELLQEFDHLVKYFNAWASASSTHDNERAIKRLQTRERFVRIHEQTLSQKKQHLAEVVKAFQSALALLKST